MTQGGRLEARSDEKFKGIIFLTPLEVLSVSLEDLPASANSTRQLGAGVTWRQTERIHYVYSERRAKAQKNVSRYRLRTYDCNVFVRVG